MKNKRYLFQSRNYNKTISLNVMDNWSFKYSSSYSSYSLRRLDNFTVSTTFRKCISLTRRKCIEETRARRIQRNVFAKDIHRHSNSFASHCTDLIEHARNSTTPLIYGKVLSRAKTARLLRTREYYTLALSFFAATSWTQSLSRDCWWREKSISNRDGERNLSLSLSTPVSFLSTRTAHRSFLFFFFPFFLLLLVTFDSPTFSLDGGENSRLEGGEHLHRRAFCKCEERGNDDAGKRNQSSP